MVQRRAARYVSNRHRNRSSVGSMIEYFNWIPLEHFHGHARLIMLYRIVTYKMTVDKSDRLRPGILTILPSNVHQATALIEHSRSFRVPPGNRMHCYQKLCHSKHMKPSWSKFSYPTFDDLHILKVLIFDFYMHSQWQNN